MGSSLDFKVRIERLMMKGFCKQVYIGSKGYLLTFLLPRSEC